MPQVDFSRFHYYPALQTGIPELMAYRELSAASKQRLMPVFELSQRGIASDLDEPIAAVSSATGDLPFVLDLSKEPAPAPYRYPGEDPVKVQRETEAQEQYNSLLSSLMNPTDGFARWRELAQSFPNAIPALQFADPGTQGRQILRQAALFSHGDQSLAIRITEEYAGELSDLVPQIISVLRSPEQLLIIADCGQRRQRLAQRAQFAMDVIARILASIDIAERPLIQAACMSSWYTKPDEPGVRDYESQDWALWREARAGFPFAFGDYGAMHRFPRRTTYVPGDFVPTVTVPLDESWRAYKHTDANDRTGWETGSRLLRDEGVVDRGPDCWGRQLIIRAAQGDLAGIDSVRFWHASRVNIHLTRQIDVAGQNVNDYGDEEGE